MDRGKSGVVRITGKCLDLLYGDLKTYRKGHVCNEADVALELKVYGAAHERMRLRITDRSASRSILSAAGCTNEDSTQMDQLGLECFDEL